MEFMQKLEIISRDVLQTCFFKTGTFIWIWLLLGLTVWLKEYKKVWSDEDTETFIDFSDVAILKV